MSKRLPKYPISFKTQERERETEERKGKKRQEDPLRNSKKLLGSCQAAQMWHSVPSFMLSSCLLFQAREV